VEAELLNVLVAIVPQLPATPPTGEIPDSFGYAFASISQETFRALVRGQRDVFERLFPLCFNLALQAVDRLRIEMNEYSLDTRALHSSDLLLELLDLCGYAYIDASLFGGTAWEIVTAVWNDYLSPMTNAHEIIQWIVANDNYRRNQFVVTQRGVLGTSRMQEFYAVMQEHGLVNSSRMVMWDEDRRAEPVDPSAAAFFQSVGIGDDARCVFFAQYLMQHPAAAGIDPPRNTQHFLESVDRIKEMRAKGRSRGRPPFLDDME
jgi:hypothetical protein